VRRLPAFGLRPQLAGALVIVSAVTLLVAAVGLLSPLQDRLRRNAENNLKTAVFESRDGFRSVKSGDAGVDIGRLDRVARALAQRAGARVAVLDPDLSRIYDSDPDLRDNFADAEKALRTGRSQATITGNTAFVAVPVRIGDAQWAVAARKPLGDVSGSVRDVRRAFIAAGAVGLIVALVLGIGLATALLRRLARLRDAARDLDAAGGTAPLPVDEARDELGEVTRAFAAMQQRVRTQEEARRAFVATASHELRTPLASLHGMLELLEEQLRDGRPEDLTQLRDEVTRAREQSDRLNGLATNLLDLSRIDADVALRTERVELGELCRAVAGEFERQGRVALAVPEGCWALGDPGAIARIVRILVDNAVRFSPADQPVRVQVGGENGTVAVTVEDDGPGIPGDEADLIFERFRRGSQPGRGAGFGLGLAIGRELATRMGGTLTLARPGPGALFVLHLPRG
jgi:signal transduction histidine kinase